MLKKKAMGIIFANMHDNAVSEMTQQRSMASLPFGGRYRMIDFYLSGLTDAGISQVAVITKSNYQSLMDHIESGRSWDLARRKGITILPPYAYTNADSNSAYHGRIAALYGIMDYLEHATAETVVMMDTDHVCTLDIEDMIEQHYRNKADVSIACTDPDYDPDNLKNCVSLKEDDTGRVIDIMINRCSEGYSQSINVFVIERKLLLTLIADAMAHMNVIFERDILLANIESLRIQSYHHKGYVKRITSLKTYFEANMDLIDPATVDELFLPRPIYTKVHDSPPTRYGLSSSVSNSVVADGCTVEGTVENSVLFRGVEVEEGAVVKNCILMQDTKVMSGAVLENVIADKSVVFTANQYMKSTENYPLYVKKRTIV